jgi:TolA-binding protein
MQQDYRDSAALSTDISAPSPSHQPKKRKSTNTVSRGVATLTPEQLAKKRANDREAQRAIRERIKAQIETLERRIQELTSQQPHQELQAIIRQKDAIQAENEEIRRRLASIMSIIQPVVGAQGLTGTIEAS